MPASDTPNINVIALASDDDIWVIQTDLSGLQTVLENPAGFVASHITIGGKPGNLVQPFVIVFQEIADKEGGPDVLIQGINHTALLTVKFSDKLVAEDDGQPIYPVDQEHTILQHGTAIYSHLELANMSRAQIASSIIKSITSMENHNASLNGLTQTLNGTAVEPSNKLVFTHNPAQKPQFVYQGATNPPVPLAVTESGGGGSGDQTCMMSNGDANSQGQVIVNGVIIKTYAQ
jgi:hypothetical protein